MAVRLELGSRAPVVLRGSMVELLGRVGGHSGLVERLGRDVVCELVCHAFGWRSWQPEHLEEPVRVEVAGDIAMVSYPGVVEDAEEPTNHVLCDLLWRQGWVRCPIGGLGPVGERLRARGARGPSMRVFDGWTGLRVQLPRTRAIPTRREARSVVPRRALATGRRGGSPAPGRTIEPTGKVVSLARRRAVEPTRNTAPPARPKASEPMRRASPPTRRPVAEVQGRLAPGHGEARRPESQPIVQRAQPPAAAGGSARSRAVPIVPVRVRSAEDRQSELVQVLGESGPASRQWLQRRLGWSRSTLRNVLSTAVEQGRIQALAAAPRSPAQLYQVVLLPTR